MAKFYNQEMHQHKAFLQKVAGLREYLDKQVLTFTWGL
jgi:hypothetical protein